MYYVYVAVYGRANDLNMVGEHTIKPRELESQTPTLEDCEEVERERLRQKEIEWEDEMERQRVETQQAVYQDFYNKYVESLAAFETDSSSAEEDEPPTTSRPESKFKEERSKASAKSFLGDEQEKGVDDSSSDLDSNISQQADDEDPDLLTIGVEREKTWITMEDIELKRIQKLAAYLRNEPLLPSPPANCESLLHCEGLNFPLVHCAFENCEWISDSRPCLRCTVDENAWKRHVARGMWCELRGREHHRHGIIGCCGLETCLKQHIVDCHSDALLESFGEAELRQPFLGKKKIGVGGNTNSNLQKKGFGSSGDHWEVDLT